MNNKKAGIFILVFFVALGVAFLGYYYSINRGQQKLLLPIVGADQNHHIQPFSFVNQDGKVITEKDAAGKVCVVYYFFATCTGICPVMNEHMTQVYKAFRGNSKVLIMGHTVDPEEDSVQALKAYSYRFDADAEQWMFLTGDKKKLYDMARYSYMISAEDDTAGVSIDKDFIHDKHYALVDPHGRIRGFYDGLTQSDILKIIKDINLLLQEEQG